MATSILTISILSIFLLSSFADAAKKPPKPQAFTFPITKDLATNQYYAPIQIGSNSTSFNVVVDLGGKFLFFNSEEYFQASSGYRPIKCNTKKCKIADGIGCVFCFLSPPVPRCTNNTCSDYSLNPFSGTQDYAGLGEDVLHVVSTSGNRYDLKDYPFQYTDAVLREQLSSLTAGVVGLGRTRISLPAQIASGFKIRQKFALCLPSFKGTGNLIIGPVSYVSPFLEIVKNSFFSTPMIRNPVSTYMNEEIGNLTVEYFINVKSIRVGETTLSINKTLLSIDKKTGNGGTNLRTVRPYTVLHGSIFRVLVDEFVKATASMNIKRVASVAPFGACFDPKTLTYSKTGPNVPIIDLVMQSVYWRFYGANTMVLVNDDALCLAFVDGGVNAITSIVVGGYQMANYLLEFDVASERIKFSIALGLINTDCSKFKAA